MSSNSGMKSDDVWADIFGRDPEEVELDIVGTLESTTMRLSGLL
jgi:hypothetical protein